MNLRALMEKSPDADFLREMIGYGAQRLCDTSACPWQPDSPAPPEIKTATLASYTTRWYTIRRGYGVPERGREVGVNEWPLSSSGSACPGLLDLGRPAANQPVGSRCFLAHKACASDSSSNSSRRTIWPVLSKKWSRYQTIKVRGRNSDGLRRFRYLDR